MQLKEVTSKYDLAVFLNVKYKTLTYILYGVGVDFFYETFEIGKSDGSSRIINAPTGPLKLIQHKILNALYSDREYKVDKIASHGFEKGKSIFSNSAKHINKDYLISVDIESFFDSFHFGRVKGYFYNNKNYNFDEETSIMLANLLTFKGNLPQGAPTSPIVANMITDLLDIELLKLSKKYRLFYTRYADDLSFSTNDKKILKRYEDFIIELKTIISNYGFKINKNKTRFSNYHNRQEVTGLIVNKKINVKREYYKKVRAIADTLYRGEEIIIDNKPGNINQLEGMFSFINQVEKFNNRKSIEKTNKAVYRLNGKEKEYQKFLFYKYCINNDKPLIFTEGKTDPRYLKGALYKHFKDYPELIEKNDEGFSLKFSFFNRTNVNSYFFTGSKTGGDAIGIVSNYYIHKNEGQVFINSNRDFYNKKETFYSYFTEHYDNSPKYPIILLFDNEQNKGMPLRKFINSNNLSILEDNLSTNVKGNLFVLTNPLVKDKEQCEIEDLFDDDLLLKFTYDGKVNKNSFSNYVLKNFSNIDFSDFKPLLDELKKIIIEFNV